MKKALFPVGWRVLTWLTFNLGVQLLPIWYFWTHRVDKPDAFWEYVNCTVAILIAFGMLVAAISDILTEKSKLGLDGRVGIGLGIVGVLGFWHRAAHDEFIRKVHADWELFFGSACVAIAVIATGTFLKAKIWYNQVVENEI